MGRALGGSIDRLGLGKFGTSLANNMAGGLANAATRSLVNGSDFGDNLMAALPDIIGQTIGNLVADGVASSGKMSPLEKDLVAKAKASANATSADVDVAGAAPPATATSAASATTPAPTTTATIGPITVRSLSGGDPQVVADELKLLPADALDFLASKKVQFVAVQDSVADYDPTLKGVIPRGYIGVLDSNGKQQTWDSVPGMYDPKTNTVIIGTSGKNSHGSWDFVFHETGHAIDAKLGYLSSNPAFKAAYSPTASTYNPTNITESYYTLVGNPSGYYSETFAESFAGYYRGMSSSGPSPSWNTGQGISNINTGRPSLSSYWQTFKWPSPPPPPKPASRR